MYKNILIPVAFGEDRDHPRAEKVAKHLSSEGALITLLHVLEQIPVYAAEFVPSDLVIGNRERLASRLQVMAAELPNAQSALIEGATGRSITDYAKDHGVDLIVMPSHQPALSDILLGSTAAWVTRHAPCAVHVIR
ncbi:universal stress protein [Tateyamaria sp. ANG-S1]|uniref:universal stress protein n=1 Tax=Tateyamaria sp. ANG-S1 TaxID=1577905 RepID=UPI00057FDE0C|nr:universal stress protein [Tateyamaria sp. ANG-S1]KIC50989.1 universal stress protein [Tateyamaria sp. ANG-S1]